jgi:hypothetical protein
VSKSSEKTEQATTTPEVLDGETPLYAPDGRKWIAASAEEVVNLQAQGYSLTPPKKK